MKAMWITILFICLIASLPVEAKELTDFERCILRVFQTEPDSVTIGQAKSKCTSIPHQISETQDNEISIEKPGIVEGRMIADDENILKPFTLMAHKKNFILLGAHNFQGWNSEYHEQISGLDSIDFTDTEVQFQLSIKVPLAVNLFDKHIDVFAAYTVKSFWQLYNSDISSPFRETNHQPEAWIQVRPDFELFGFKHNASALGITHQSNGQASSLSRSWNRIFAAFGFERGSFAFMLSPWIRIPEDDENDDNSDITDYLGHGELRMAYKHDDNTFTFMTRNNLESGFSRGAIEIGWSFPLFNYKYFKGYIQYFSGYGISLIDYDQYVNQIGVGLLLTEIL
jgi:phospholipase A1